MLTMSLLASHPPPFHPYSLTNFKSHLFLFYFHSLRSRCTEQDGRAVEILVPVDAKIFLHVQTGTVVHPTSYSMLTGSKPAGA
jgi:hypothetical protein